MSPIAYSGWICAWQPGVGDPTFVGWFTLAAYFGSAWLCGRARRVAPHRGQGASRHGSRLLWGVLAAGLVAFGVNKQLDLQSGLTELGRGIVQEMDWYESRRVLQLGVIGAVSLLAVGLCAWLAHLARDELLRVMPALVGGGCLCAFVAIRAASFHHLDRLLGMRLAGGWVSAILELGGIALIAIGALTYRRAPK